MSIDESPSAQQLVSPVYEGVVDDSFVLVGLSAARAWGMPLPPSTQSQNTVMVSRWDGKDARPRKGSTDGHRIALPVEHLTRLGGRLVTNAPRTWLDCAALMSDEHLAAMGDWAIGAEVMCMADVEAMLAWGKGRRGVQRARLVSSHLRTGVESPQESRLRWHIVQSGLPEPEINPTIVVRGRRTARLDLAYRQWRLGIEYDGDWHASTADHDHKRRQDLEQAGWRILVAYKEDLDEPAGFLEIVREQVDFSTRQSRSRW